MTGKGEDGTTVKSLERMFRIVAGLKELEGAGITELADHLAFPKSTIHRHLSTMQSYGYVLKEEQTYYPGLQFLDVGITAREKYEVYESGRRKTVELAERTGERAWCMIEENGLGWYLSGASGDHPVFPPVRIGERVHLHQTAAGKAILAHLPDDRVRSIIDRHGLPAETEHSITDSDELIDELESVRNRGYSVNEEESLLGLHAIGASIKNNETGELYGALSISGPANRIDLSPDSEYTDLVIGAANEIEINLSYS
jgi:DNA-binding IclR family transcriptional regulator